MPDAQPSQDPSAVPAAQGQQTEQIDLNSWIKKFTVSEKIMKNEFLPKYKLAKLRCRSEYEVRNRGSKKMTHDQVSLTYSIGNSFVSSSYFKAPHCNLTAREEVQHEQIENTEIKVNDWLKDNEVKRTVRRIIWDAYLGGFGARFIDKEYDDVEDPNNWAIPPQVDAMGQEIAPGQRARIVLKDKITLTRIRPDMVRFPQGFDFDNYQSSPWIGFVSIMPIEDVKNQKNWDETARNSIEGQKYSTLSEFDNKGKEIEGDDLYAAISFLFQKPEYDHETIKLCIFCHKYPQAPLQMIEFDKGTVGYPIKFLYFNPLDDDCSYPNGDPWNFESQLNAVDLWWKKFRKHVEKSNPKTVYDMGNVTPEEMQKMKAANDLEFVGIKNTQRRSVQELFYEFNRSQVHPDVSKFYEVARELISELAPRSGLARGAEDQKVDTATEAKIINTGEIIDLEARIDTIADFIKDIILDVAGILEKSQDSQIPLTKPSRDEKGIEVLDPVTGKPAAQIVHVDKSGFTSKINADVDVESMQAQNKDVLFRQLTQFVKLLLGFEPILNKKGKTLEPLFWIERIMETRNIRNIEKGITDLPPPVFPPEMSGIDPLGGSVGDPERGGLEPQENPAQEDAMAEMV